MGKVKAECKAKHIGFSFHDKADLLDRILTEHPEMELVQLQINYVDWDNESIESRKCYEVATKHKKPVIVMEPVKGGSLAKLPEEADKLFKAYHPDVSAASWAMRFAASLENAFVVLSGMSTLEQVVDNTSYMRAVVPLNDAEKEHHKEGDRDNQRQCRNPVYQRARTAWTAARNRYQYQNISLLYNDQKQFALTLGHAVYYMNLAQDFGKASECIGCKHCEEHCPQHIAIVEQLKEVAATFETGGLGPFASRE